jgi:hypothetical protein
LLQIAHRFLGPEQTKLYIVWTNVFPTFWKFWDPELAAQNESGSGSPDPTFWPVGNCVKLPRENVAKMADTGREEAPNLLTHTSEKFMKTITKMSPWLQISVV